MNENIVDMKKLDKTILLRLLSYTKPFIGYILLSFILLLLIVGLELVKPVLIGKAVDDIITDYNKDYRLVTSDVKGSTQIGDYVVIEDLEKYSQYEKATILYKDTEGAQFYLAIGMDKEIAKEFENDIVVKGEDGALYTEVSGSIYDLIEVNQEEIKSLRRIDISELKIISAI